MAVRYRNTSLKRTNVRIKAGFQARFLRILFTISWAISKKATKHIIRKLFFKPVTTKLSPVQETMRDNAQTFTFQSHDTTLQAYQWGQGPAVLFVHGWAGQGAQFCKYIPDLVSKGYSVIAFDHAGHGKSQGRTANYFRFSNAVYDLEEQVPGMNLCAIVAHSLGAAAAINYMWRTKKKPVTILIAPALHLIEMLNSTFTRYGLPHHIFNSLISEIGEQTGHVFSRENPIDLLKSLTHDIMIIHDKNDKAVAYEDSWNASILYNNISLVPTTGLGHIRILEDESIKEMVINKIDVSSRSDRGNILLADDPDEATSHAASNER